MIWPTDPISYLVLLSLVTLAVAFIQIRINENDLKKHQKILISEKSKLDSMVAAMADGVLLFDLNLNLLIINPVATRLLGMPDRAKITFQDVSKKLSGVLDLQEKIRESSKTGNLVTVESLFLDGHASQLLITPTKDQSGVLLGTVVILHDVTAEKELERVREEFTAMMVHELRAPLTVVHGATEMFVQNPQLTVQPQGQEMIKTMETSAAGMLSLVNDLLDAAKIEAGKFQISKTKDNLSEIVRDRIGFFRAMAQDRQISFSEDIPDSDLEAEFDKDRVAQILNNLISNAIKYTGTAGKITVSAYRINSSTDIKWRYPDNIPSVKIDNPAVLISVSDTGSGIAQEKIVDLFSKFKQLQPSAGKLGTGLGLVVAKGIIESHGGQIFVQSHVNEGSIFYFTLPG